MKAERRHELQTNTLAQFLSDLPLYLRFHANKILIGVILICLIVILVRHRMGAAREQVQMTRGRLAQTQEALGRLEFLDRTNLSDAGRALERKKIASEASVAIEQVLADTKDPDDAAVRAAAWIARGDLNWELANMRPPAGAATQPQLALQHPPAVYLENAEDAYKNVLKNYASQKVAKVTALLGLAAIEENRGNWDQAKEYYNQVLADQSLAQAFRDVARQRLELIPRIRTPVYLGSFSSTQPSPPATMAAATLPATQPATHAESRMTKPE
jgi:tetratricopeptide (TPR) repeat protein